MPSGQEGEGGLSDNLELRRRFAAIKSYYGRVAHRIQRCDEWGIDPYAWSAPETGICLSPIEMALWDDIRMLNMVMYPQYPVGRFFVDFANPGARVAIECDGKRWHTDVVRDRERQAEIEEMGWVVYRITGRDCFTDTVEGYDDEGRPTFEYSRARAFVTEICRRHPVQRGKGNGSGPRRIGEILLERLEQRRAAAR